MNAGFGSWLLGMALGAGAPGVMASGILIALAAATIVAALIYAISGFGFAASSRHRSFCCFSVQ